MSWQFTVYAYPLVFATVVSAALGGYTVRYIARHGRDDTTVVFLAVNVGLVLWSGFSTLKLLSTDPTIKLLTYRLLYFGVSPLGALALLFALAYTDRRQWLRPSVVAGLFLAPVAYWVLLFTNPADLAIEATRFVEVDGLTVLRVDTGPAHLLLQYGYSAVLAALALGLIGTEAARLGRTYHSQAVLLGLGVAAPILFEFLSGAAVPPFDPDGVNLIPSSAAVTSITLGLAIFRYRLLDLPPIAYTTAMADSPDGVLVLDSAHGIVHTNRSGREILDLHGESDPFDVSSLGIDLEAEANDVVAVDAADGSRLFYSVRSQPLERHRRLDGWVLVFREVTAQQERKQELEAKTRKLELLNRIVRHDIRNDMSVVLGYAPSIAEEIEDETARERFDSLVTHGEHVVELTEIIRDLMQTMLDDDETVKPIQLAPVLGRELDSIRGMDGAVTVHSPAELPTVTVQADEMLGTVFRNLLTNAVRHTDTECPAVTISVTEHEDDVVVDVADDGPGVPDEHKERVFGRGEKGLESPGTGVGLYLVDTLVESYGGDVWVADNTPRGAVFSVRLQKPDAVDSPWGEY
ncbi:sensor histidine kinase [Halorientalis salina]|uniref:sensor histidine kinase n=1 Tax=Halorientalis salina TaxID=2932266 RepID=UPI0010ABE9BD|nr:histidine kinase N-terminal 7TM domain-containing protein [Halorientalis salina]